MKNNIITEYENISFLRLNNEDLKEILNSLNNYYITYRDVLNLPKELTIGIEIEYEHLKREKVDNYIDKNLPFWLSKTDESVKSGGEINSPVLTDSYKNWQDLKKLCTFLKKKQSFNKDVSGGHIHIGNNILNDDIYNYQNLLKLIIVYEPIIFRFIYGDKLSARKNMKTFAHPIAEELSKCINQINNFKNIDDLKFVLSSDRRKSINFCNTKFTRYSYSYLKNTIEFRCPNGTINEIIWQNNINICAKLLLAAANKNLDTDFINYKIDNISYNDYYPTRYNEVDLLKALELIDLIFDNNLDKINFLKQYIKNFQNNYGLKEAINAKKITK